MNLDEINGYLVENKDMEEMDAYSLAAKLDGKSIEEVDKHITLIPDVRQVVRQQEKVIISDVLHCKTGCKTDCKTGCKTTITIRLEDVLKSNIRQQADELGLPLSTLIRDVLTHYFK